MIALTHELSILTRISKQAATILDTVVSVMNYIPYFLGTRTEGDRGKGHYGENHFGKNSP
jgi:hypothetical protein